MGSIKQMEAYLKREYDIIVGERTLEELQQKFSAKFRKKIEVSGRSCKTGSKKMIKIEFKMTPAKPLVKMPAKVVKIPSTLGRLLSEISWGGNARIYRFGGRGFENVLTAEILQVLDFLPRKQFFGNVIAAMHGADQARSELIKQIEEVTMELLPGAIDLKPEKVAVQPDGIIASDSIYALLEAKRIRTSSFQEKQIARNLVLAHKQAADRIPLVILITGHEPPFKVQGHGKLNIDEAVNLNLDHVVSMESEDVSFSADELRSKASDSICWITWEKISGIIRKQMNTFQSDSEAIRNSVVRLAKNAIQAIEWHGK